MSRVSRPSTGAGTVAQWMSGLEETAEVIDDWQSQLMLNYIAKFRWFGIACWLLAEYFFLKRGDGTAAFLYALVLWLPYVLPRGPWAPLRFFQRFLCYLIPLFLTVIVVLLTAFSVVDVFDRMFNDRMAQTPVLRSLHLTDGNIDWFPITLICGCVAVAIAFALFYRRPVPRVRMALGVLKITLTALTICLPSYYVTENHNAGGFLGGLNGSFFGSQVGVFAALWAAGALLVLVHAREVPCPAPSSGENGAAEYLKSASGVAATALLIAFFGLNTCWSYTRNLDRFIATRDVFAMDLIAAVVGENKDLQHAFDTDPQNYTGNDPDLLEASQKEKVERDTATLRKAFPDGTVVSLNPSPPWLDQAKIVSIWPIDPGYQFGSGGSGMAVEVNELDLPQPWRASVRMQFPGDMRTTHDLKWAAPCSEKLDEVATYDKLYRSCEKQVVGRGVKFPVIDTEVPIEYVVASTFIALTGCIVILTDRIQQILNAPTATRLEPWIILDAGTRSAKAIANAWMLGLAAAPWLLMGFAVAICALQVRIAGSTSTLQHDAFIAVPLVAGVCLAPMLSASLLRQLVAVRYVRRCRWLISAEAATVEAPGIAD